jgi:FtsP/CotA-like multicopper oxidase with cupredoxin domain
MITRRCFIKSAASAGGFILLPKSPFGGPALAQTGAVTLDPGLIPKYQLPLVIPPAMPRTAKIRSPGGNKQIDYYEIAARQFSQQILPPGLPPTTVWGYGSVNHPGTFNYPSFTIEAKWEAPVRVKWINDLKNPLTGAYLPHLLAVDQTLHWANPPGPRDERTTNPTPYTGPVPIVTHVHGAHTTDESDGYAEAWFLPNASNVPAGYFREGTFYNHFRTQFFAKYGVVWESGTSVFQYPNEQDASTLWFHDHTLGMTRLNVYAGPAGFYLLRGGPGDSVFDSRNGRPATLPGPAPALGDLPGLRYYEIPLAIQDRSFKPDGSLWYPSSREFFDEFGGPYIPDSDISPIWNPEFFADTMLVNGRTWPYLNVERRRYRFRILNGCNSRFVILKLSNGLPFWQIGAEGGFLPARVQTTQLLMSPAERADVIIDFTNVPAGTEIVLQNLGPDEPFGGGEPDEDFDQANEETTGQVMQFRVVPRVGQDHSTPPERLILPARSALPEASVVRQVSLNEEVSAVLADVGPRAALLGTMDATTMPGTITPIPLMWEDPITENPALGATEVWEIYNYTVDAHPIHVHEVMFEVVDRQPFDTETGELGDIRSPEPTETGRKDTVIAYPGEITRIKATFDLPGLYVWHCHIVEHEDNEMMRPYRVGP